MKSLWRVLFQRIAFVRVSVMRLAGAAFLLAVMLPRLAVAETFDIANGDVSGLIAAINSANSNGRDDVIKLAVGGLYILNSMHSEDTGLPPVTSLIKIYGNGATITRDAAEGTPEFRIFYVKRGGNLTLNKITLTNGKTLYGGAIAGDGTLVVNDSVISSNAAYQGGGINAGGGVEEDHRSILEIRNSTVSNNVASFGGGIYAGNGATTEIIRSRITGNSAIEPYAWGGGIVNVRFGDYPDVGTSLVIRDSLIDGNSSAGQGGGLYDNTGKTVIFNSAITNNTATYGGGAIAKTRTAYLSVYYSCITRNSDSAVLDDGISPPYVVASYNWWGAVDGPSGIGSGSGDSVSSYVVFNPFLTAPTAAHCQSWMAGQGE